MEQVTSARQRPVFGSHSALQFLVWKNEPSRHCCAHPSLVHLNEPSCHCFVKHFGMEQVAPVRQFWVFGPQSSLHWRPAHRELSSRQAYTPIPWREFARESNTPKEAAAAVPPRSATTLSNSAAATDPPRAGTAVVTREAPPVAPKTVRVCHSNAERLRSFSHTAFDAVAPVPAAVT